MAKGLVKRATLTAIADAIRAKTETSDMILPTDMAAMIEGIELNTLRFMTGAVTPSHNINALNLGVVLPEANNSVFVCIFADHKQIDSGGLVSYTRVVDDGNMSTKAVGAKWNGASIIVTNDIDCTLSTSEAGSTLTNNTTMTGGRVFVGTYEWWYAYE